MSALEYLRADIEALFGGGLPRRDAHRLLGIAVILAGRHEGVLLEVPGGTRGVLVRCRDTSRDRLVELAEQHLAPARAEAIAAYVTELALAREAPVLGFEAARGEALDRIAFAIGFERTAGEPDATFRERVRQGITARPGGQAGR